MKSEQILRTHFLDLLFEGRNKNYGANELRMNYAKRLRVAFLFTLMMVFFFSVCISYLVTQNTNTKPLLIETKEWTIASNKFVFMDEKSRVMKGEKQPHTKSKSANKGSKLVFTNENIKEPEMAATNGSENEAALPEGSEHGEDITITGADSIRSTTSTRVMDSVTNIEFAPTETPASFPGGEKAWKKFLEKNIDPFAPVEDGAPAGVYTVILQFVVNSEGRMHNVKALTKHGYGMEEQAVRVIQRGPRWNPAMQNGKAVALEHRQSITFVVLQAD